jgi:16S rRNA (guanine527-N7)-methyltransferase
MTREAVAALPGVSRETLDRLDILADHLRRWSPRINLVADSTLPDLWTRHILDSAQLRWIAPPRPGLWADLGAGAGFPGLVLAALAHGTQTRVALVESDQRKAAFLRVTAQAMGVMVDIHAARIEALPPLGADTISARALAPLPKLLDLALPHLAPGGRLALPKGARHADELAMALDTHRATVESRPSMTDPESVVLILSDVTRAAPQKG